MKHLIIIFFSLYVSTGLKAQIHDNFDSSINVLKSKINHNDFKSFQRFSGTGLEFQSINDKIVLKLPKPVLKFQYNANQFDVYNATPDNMFVIKPDNTVIFNMPIAGALPNEN
ncbi:MAG TPA: hypothetical protein VFW07_12500 [Parafilimonas sp.]|nr:hypothetical protein [Parafilimonas sp.]